MIRPENLNPVRWLVIVAVVAFACSNAAAAVIFQDNFDNPTPANWTSGNPAYSPWTGASTDYLNTCAGVTKHAGSIESPGRGGSGKSFRHNLCNSSYTGNGSYYGQLDYSPQSNTYKKLYARWYMKFPVGTNANISDYLKSARWNLGSGSEVYLNYNVWGGGLSGSSWAVYPQFSGSDFSSQPQFTWYYTGISFSQVADGQWHHFEMMVDVTGNPVQIVIWVDGVQRWSFSENCGPQNIYITRVITPAIGNSGDPSSWAFPQNNTWYAFEWDDYVLSTTYVGTSGTADLPSEIPGTPSNPPLKIPGTPSNLTIN